MKTITSLFIFAAIVLLTGCANGGRGKTTLLPGLTYYAAPESLTGKLVFLYSGSDQSSDNDKCASLYAFDLNKQVLVNLTNCPIGQVTASQDAMCVIYHKGVYRQENCTNALIYSFKTHQCYNVKLDDVPKLTCMIGDHAYFILQGYNFINPGYYLITNGGNNGTKILDYDTAKNTLKTIELSRATQWEFNNYDRLHQPYNQTNTLHFYYHYSGRRLTNGKDYPEGFYKMNVSTGMIGWFSDLLDDTDDENYALIDFNGHQVLFDGDNGPMDGVTLVSAVQGPQQKQTTKYLHSFRLGYNPFADSFTLHGMSPDRRYALVLKMHATELSTSGYIYSYYLVNVVNGETRLLMEDATGVKSKPVICSSISWVAN